jgi:dihydroorotate dehydrogenase
VTGGPAATAHAARFAAVVTGVRLPFCVMNAAGAATTASELRALAHSATGAVVLPTTTVRPFLHPQFRALHNPGYDKLLPLVRELAADGSRPVVASVAGATAEELAFLAAHFAEAGAAVVEANLADDWVAATLAPFDDEAALAAVVRPLAAASPCPVWVTLPDRPHMHYARLVETLLDAGVRGVVARNEFTGFEKLQVEAPHPIDVVVEGGIETGYDVLRAIGKGARAVRVDAALRREGAGVFTRLEREMRKAADAG